MTFLRVFFRFYDYLTMTIFFVRHNFCIFAPEIKLLSIMEKDIKLAQSNALTKSRYDFSRYQKNAFYKIIEKVRSSPQATLFGELIVNFYPDDFGDISSPDHTRLAKEALRSLRHKDIEIEDEEGNWLNVGFINYVYYDAKFKTFEVEVSRKIMPQLIELSKDFTSYSLVVAMSLKSKYSQRFYELGCQYQNNKPSPTFFIDINELRDMFCLGSGYKLKSDIKKRIIDVAMSELKEAFQRNECDLWLEDWEDEVLNKGNKTRFWFRVHKRLKADTKIGSEELKRKLIGIGNMVKAIFPKDKKYVERIIHSLELDNDKIAPVYERLIRLLEEETKKKEKPGALCRYILKNDFGIA